MAYSLNKVQLIGNITHDPELRQSDGGSSFLRFSVATGRDWGTASGEKKSKTEFHKVVIFGKFAETCSAFLKKGQKVYVEGSIDTNSYETKEGEKKSFIEIISQNLILLTPKNYTPGMQPEQIRENY